MYYKPWFKLSCLYVGSVVGAGFASGQEIMQFFAIYGYRGIFGAIISCTLFMIIGSIILIKTYELKSNDYTYLINPRPKFIKIFEIIVLFFLYIGYCVMLAGSGAIAVRILGCNVNIGIYIMSVAVFLVIINNVEGLATINTVLIPFLILAIIIIASLTMKSQGKIYFSNLHGAKVFRKDWFFSSILYVSYNSIPAVVVLSTALSIIPNRKTALLGGVYGGIILLVMSLFIILPLMIFSTDLYGVEIPMLKIAGRLGRFAEYTYSLVLLIAMYTTAIGNAFGFVKRCSQLLNVKIYIVAAVFCISAIPLSKFGFIKLVEIMYPLLGYIAIVLFITVVLKDFCLLFIKFFRRYNKARL